MGKKGMHGLKEQSLELKREKSFGKEGVTDGQICYDNNIDQSFEIPLTIII